MHSHLNVFTATEFKNGEEGGFYVMSILPQLKLNKQKCTQSQAYLRGPALTGHKDGQTSHLA